MFKGVTRTMITPVIGGLYNVSGVVKPKRNVEMKAHIVEALEALKQANAITAFSITKERLQGIEAQALEAGFDPEWIAMVFDLTNVKDWVRMGLKLEHLCKLFKGRVVCVEMFIKEKV